MNGLQKLIKVLAIGLAIFIIINIFLFAVYLVSSITGIDFHGKDIGGKDFSETYKEIKNIDISIGNSNLIIEEGSEFKIDASNISDKFYANERNNKLVLKEKGIGYNPGIGKGTIIIYIPKESNLDKLEIDFGASNVTITDVVADNFEIECGAGSLIIEDSKFKKAEIECGAGLINTKNTTFRNLEIDGGVGKVNLESRILGNSKIKCGVGELNLALLGNKDSYSLKCTKGLGSINIDGENQKNNVSYGNGNNKLEIIGGIGNINILFK